MEADRSVAESWKLGLDLLADQQMEGPEIDLLLEVTEWEHRGRTAVVSYQGLEVALRAIEGLVVVSIVAVRLAKEHIYSKEALQLAVGCMAKALLQLWEVA